MSLEDLDKYLITEGWSITQEETERSTKITYLNDKDEVVIVYAEGMFTNDLIRMTLRITDAYGRTLYYECDYKYFNRDQWEDDKFFAERVDAIAFWAMHNRIPTEIVKDAWVSIRPLFDEVQRIAIVNRLVSDSERLDGDKGKDEKPPEQTNLF